MSRASMPDPIQSAAKAVLPYLQIYASSLSFGIDRFKISFFHVESRVKLPQANVLEAVGLQYVEKVLFVKHILMLAVHVCRVVKDRKSTRLNSSHLGISYAVF